MRVALLEAAYQFHEKVEGEIGMQATDNVEFRGAFAHALIGSFVHFVEREGVRAGGSGIASKRAELAMRHANVGGIDVAIDVVIGDVAVAFFANEIGEPADGQEIGRVVEATPSSKERRAPSSTLSAMGFRLASVSVSSATIFLFIPN